ncbi:hypothetical protein H310_03740 [Aphanomyces invadans]|uniref:Uncharacterized protein n=1 Tax=Aphanomyces invadans TaxID=157072 RepID=A0A024UJV8_9STRA|nr:hypothetical protein H310_03740 [Aphanomyces invadans]ETW06157.1 hypothetical protein H310_03740 [Aphanomyces invadans]|eukprot:XP_008865934.1 hypothetical protein H310_03740 [Aphanomyces invadans]
MKRRHGSDSDRHDTTVTASDQTFFDTHGYLLLPQSLSAAQLSELREECDQLYAHTSADDLVDMGCVLDIFASGNRTQRSRVDLEAYVALRNALVHRPLSSDLQALLFDELPANMQALLPHGTGPFVYFFNEHYVVKPPQSNVEFRWHQDDTEQLGMCVHRESIPWYLSAWIALDDVTSTNGALQFRALQGPDHCSSEPVLASAGSILAFRSDVWHFSAANTSDAIRRAFYVQYSPVPITSRPSSKAPLCCAIPLLPQISDTKSAKRPSNATKTT